MFFNYGYIYIVYEHPHFVNTNEKTDKRKKKKNNRKNNKKNKQKKGWE